MNLNGQRKKPAERRAFIVEFLRQKNELYPTARNGATVDVLDSEFVDAYIDFSGVSWVPTMYGAVKCKQLSRDLTEMWQTGELSRYLTRLPTGSRNEGFPGWVYSYTL